MSRVIDSIERSQLRRVPAFAAGDRLRVHFQVVEGTRRRTQVFEGVVLKRQGSGARETFTVRKQSFGVGVERTFPVHSPKIERIEIAARGDVRRAKLYYLRDRVGRSARVRERRFTGAEEDIYGDGVMPPPEADEAATAPGAEADPRDEGVEEVIEAEEADPAAGSQEAEGAEAEGSEPEAEGAEAEGAEAEAGGAEAEAADADAEAEGADAPEGGDASEGGEAAEAGGDDSDAGGEVEQAGPPDSEESRG